jgi:hypothetical protein
VRSRQCHMWSFEFSGLPYHLLIIIAIPVLKESPVPRHSADRPILQQDTVLAKLVAWAELDNVKACLDVVAAPIINTIWRRRQGIVWDKGKDCVRHAAVVGSWGAWNSW